ncbi:hypothetical protein GGI15_001530 [Coemansia interrupta]|uniref:RING-type domain-containing protein n=1 Tax=Coemansia interrupta TaxID=1126814 RepID=A0A9W8HJN1_9FUNG|nr:hypothetical protein GGI15_001530 [Coemansia interrupta]
MSCVICCESLFESTNKEDTSTLSGGSRGEWQTQPSVLRCGHVFHQVCIGAWLAQSNRASCPTCRKQHTGDPITLFFNADNPMPSDGQTPSISQLQHRNHMIRTLCKNVEAAQNEIKSLKKQIEDTTSAHSTRCIQHEAEMAKFKQVKERVSGYKSAARDLKLANMKLDKAVAEKAREVEELQMRLSTTQSELEDQKRVVANMGDVRATNEQLARSLKREKTRNETLQSLNTQLASKVSSYEQRLAQSCLASDDRPAPLMVDGDKTDIHVVITDTDTDLEEDAVAISNSVATSWAQTGSSRHASAKLASKFELPLAAIEEQQKEVKNPFAIASTGGPSEFLFRLTLDSIDLGNNVSQSSVPSSINKRNAIGRKIAQPVPRSLSYANASAPGTFDGMGGSRRKGSNSVHGKRSANSIQARINWGTKK